MAAAVEANAISPEVSQETSYETSKDDVKKAGSAYPLWRLALVALPQLSVQVLWCFIGPNSAPYMQHLGAAPFLATLNNIAGPITGFFTGPIVGAVSDGCTSKYGRRRPVIVAGLISLWIAGMLFAGSEHIFPEGKAIFFAAPMYWVMDVTINVLQTPHRALVADLASDAQQIPMQVAFVFMMAVGNFIGFSIMQVYKVPVEHMMELMLGICLLNTFCVGVQFLVAKETPLEKDLSQGRRSACAPLTDVSKAVKDSPRLLYHLAFVQCLVWVGNTAWNLYSGQWFENSVYLGDEKGTPEQRLAYEEGQAAFAFGGQCKAVLQLISTLTIIGLLLNTTIRPRLLYAPCIFIGAVVSLLAAFAVHHSGAFAEICLAVSVMPETGSFAIPFGLVAILNKRAAEEGKQVSTALQMALLNCCVTVGQQICTLALAIFQGTMSFQQSLPCIFILAAVAQIVAGGSTLFLNDKIEPDQPTPPTKGGSIESDDVSNEASLETAA